jgi:hypothetical protein
MGRDGEPLRYIPERLRPQLSTRSGLIPGHAPVEPGFYTVDLDGIRAHHGGRKGVSSAEAKMTASVNSQAVREGLWPLEVVDKATGEQRIEWRR